MRISRTAAVELVVISAFAVVTWLASSALPARMQLADLSLLGAALLLAQGLVRDVARLVHLRLSPRERGGGPVCMCVESVVGASVILAALATLACGVTATLAMSRVVWTAGVVAIMLVGFLVKDAVFDWRARTVRRAADHAKLVPW
jgi:hypothetical protein